MTSVALPEMRRFGYPDGLATGVIAAGGTLGILIPPSVVLAVYAFITEQDVGRLFIAGILPGLLAVAMYMATVRLLHGRNLPAGEAIAWRERLASLRGVWAVLLLFVLIIGGIYLGVVTPTEAAAAGAFLTCADRRRCAAASTARRSWPAWSRRCAPRSRSSRS